MERDIADYINLDNEYCKICPDRNRCELIKLDIVDTGMKLLGENWRRATGLDAIRAKEKAINECAAQPLDIASKSRTLVVYSK